MSSHLVTETTLIIAFKTVSLLLGLFITYLAFKAYRRTGNRSLGALSLGFGIVTLGTLLAGVADQVVKTAFLTGLLIESALLAIGFAVIVYSLYTTGP